MALDMDAIGRKIGPLEKDYDWRDVVLYALGVGAGPKELEYCYEKDLKVIPTFSIAMIYNTLTHFGKESNINLAGILHGEQELIFHNPIPTSGKLITQGEVTDYFDKGKEKGALVKAESVTSHSNGKKLFTSIVTLFARLDGGFGGENAPKTTVDFPERTPDIAIADFPSFDQPLIYRLSGDIFSLHVDPEFAEMSGFDRPIMHGLCTYGFGTRALIGALIPGEPERTRRIRCRFTKPLYPGTRIETQIWKKETGVALWRIVNQETGETVIDHGIFEYGDVPKDEIRFDDQVAIVTGAGAGLGKVYALELAKRGAKVVVNDLGTARDGSGDQAQSPADLVVNEIKALGGEAVANYDSVATVEGGQNIVQTALDHFGSIDILINNAGILRDKSFAKMESSDWRSIMDVHLTGAFMVTQPAFKIMKEKGYGRVIFTTSAAGLYGNFGQTNYGAAKMGLVGFMNTLKLEGAKYNVHVNTVAPIAATRLTEDILPEDLFKKMKPEYVAPVVIYLCSKDSQESGEIYNVGMGFLNRAAILTSESQVLKKDGSIPTAENVYNEIKTISNLSKTKEYYNLTEQVGDFLEKLKETADSV